MRTCTPSLLLALSVFAVTMACRGPRQWAEALDASSLGGSGGSGASGGTGGQPSGGTGGTGMSAGAGGTSLAGMSGTTKDGAASSPPVVDGSADLQNAADADLQPDGPRFAGPCGTGGRPCLENVIQVAVGAYHSCALVQAGSVFCWGQNLDGQVGGGPSGDVATPRLVAGLASVSGVDAGISHTCAVTTEGYVWCWGSGGLGTSSRVSSAAPIRVEMIDSAITVATGGKRGCAVLREGSVHCWRDSYTDVRTPAVVTGLPSATAVAIDTGYSHGGCALVTGGAVWCWTNSEAPADSDRMLGVMSIAAGSTHSCLVDSARSVWCRGGNSQGELGDGSTLGSYDKSVRVVGLGDAIAVSAGDRFTCALRTDGTVRCWGRNEVEQLGVGSTSPSNVPVPVAGVGSAKSISSGDGHTCAVIAGGRVQCWGDNGQGQLGAGTVGGTMRAVTVVAQ
jgi:alpha-tubulin suppressor-like RCC1 family protein